MTNEELIAQYEAFVWHTARKMQRSYRLSQEDTQDIGARALLGLVAMPPDVREFPWYVMQAIVNQCINELKTIRKHRVVEFVPTFSVEYDEDKEDLPIPDTRVDVERDVLHRDVIDRCLSILTPEESRIFAMYLGRDGHTAMTQAEIAAVLGKTSGRIGQIMKQATTRMRNRFNR